MPKLFFGDSQDFLSRSSNYAPPYQLSNPMLRSSSRLLDHSNKGSADTVEESPVEQNVKSLQSESRLSLFSISKKLREANKKSDISREYRSFVFVWIYDHLFKSSPSKEKNGNSLDIRENNSIITANEVYPIDSSFAQRKLTNLLINNEIILVVTFLCTFGVFVGVGVLCGFHLYLGK